METKYIGVIWGYGGSKGPDFVSFWLWLECFWSQGLNERLLRVPFVSTKFLHELRLKVNKMISSTSLKADFVKV